MLCPVLHPVASGRLRGVGAWEALLSPGWGRWWCGRGPGTGHTPLLAYCSSQHRNTGFLISRTWQWTGTNQSSNSGGLEYRNSRVEGFIIDKLGYFAGKTVDEPYLGLGGGRPDVYLHESHEDVH